MMRLVKKILKKSNSGFTMIELSIVILAMAIFGAITAEILSNATQNLFRIFKKTKIHIRS